MESDLSQAFQEELTCFICLSYLTDPVTVSCGHSFCRACLCLSWEDSQLPVQCPMCREPSQQKDFRTNIVMKKLVSIARKANLMKYLSSEEHQCVTHKETKGIFCMENRIYLCQLCSDSHEHRGHNHCPIEAAAEDQMERLLKQMTSLWEQIQEIQENLEAESRIKILFINYLSMREDMIRMEYRKWHAVLCEEEEEHIAHMKNEGDCVVEKLRESKDMMIQKSKQLREMHQDLMAMSQEPYVVLLQGLDDIFRCESMQLSIPQGMKPELSALPMTGLTERFNSFKVHIFFEKLFIFCLKKNLFNVMRRASFRPHHQNTSVEPSGCYLASWGSQSFISGKYYWDVDLKDSWDWAVRVCTNSWLMSRNKAIETKGAFLLFCVKEGSHYSLLTTNPVIHHYLEKPLGRVGVFLDCDARCLSFLNIAKSSLIYKYPHKTFKHSVWPFFSYGHIIP
ncbi:tripartite motif-containing protein 43B-like [Arvicola amphibius]|uniref:tripartite motif-containing protein 43B-like n=1 Tax=Arvicola amphibius TaxID=1047088 RepID=UPI0018E3D2B7|nr:tripartite motif-containing protein 43B-like [Arvicola amphibius]